MTISSPLGRISISSDAIAQIVAETVRESYGVVAMAGPKWLPARSTRGIEIGRDGDAVTVDVHVVVEYGLNLAEVASSVRNRVGYEVGTPVITVDGMSVLSGVKRVVHSARSGLPQDAFEHLMNSSRAWRRWPEDSLSSPVL